MHLKQVIKGTSDVSSQYMATMNCIFAAQKNVSVLESNRIPISDKTKVFVFLI